MNSIVTNVLRDVSDVTEGVSIKVATNFYADTVHLYTVGEIDTSTFGDIDLYLNAEFARQLGSALIAAAREVGDMDEYNPFLEIKGKL